jgi:hypothetical protein
VKEPELCVSSVYRELLYSCGGPRSDDTCLARRCITAPALVDTTFGPAGHSGSMTTKPYDELTGRFIVATGPSQLPVSAFRASVTVIMRVIGSIGEAMNPDLS